MKFILEAIFFVLIPVIAFIQARMMFNQKAIHHGWWDLLFGVLIAAAFWYQRDWYLLSALILEHFVFFSPELNYFRVPREAFFYIHSVPKKGSIWDKLALVTGNFYPFIWVAGLVGLAVLQFFI